MQQGTVLAVWEGRKALPKYWLQGKAERGQITACVPGAQAVALAATEESLYAGGLDGTDVYPAALVVLTSAAGIWAVRRLVAGGRVGPAAAWLLQCIHAAKLSMLLIPEVAFHDLSLSVLQRGGMLHDLQCLLPP